MADEDNENDEYHTKLNPVDVWANYAWLAGQGWTQERIARAKGVKQAIVSKRINLNDLSDGIKQFIHQRTLDEAHLIEISALFIDEYFESWLTTSEAQLELVEKAVRDKSKNGSKTVRAFKADVDIWKAFIKEAETVYDSLSAETTLYHLDQDPPTPYTFDAQKAFVDELSKRGARSMAKVKEAARAVQLEIKSNLESYETYIREQSTEAARSAAGSFSPK